MIDAMAHLHDPRVADADALLQRAAHVGITDVITAGVDPLAENLAPPERCQPYGAGMPRLWRAAGLHPQAVTARWRAQVDRVHTWAAQGALVAVGEIGLDGREGMPEAELQEQALHAQLEVARGFGLPVIVHNVRRTQRLLELLRAAAPLPAGGVLHGFGGPADLIAAWSALGLHFSVGGQAARPAAKKVHLAAAAIPEGLLLVESDTPDHAPGLPGPSEPAHVPVLLDAVAALRGTSAAHLAQTTAANARRLYKLPPARDN